MADEESWSATFSYAGMVAAAKVLRPSCFSDLRFKAAERRRFTEDASPQLLRSCKKSYGRGQDSMGRRVIWSCVLLAMLGGDSWLRAEEQSQLRERMKRAAELTSLDGTGIKPWHLKLSVDILAEDGKSKGKSSVEEWWAGPKLYRVIYELPDRKVTELRNAEGSFRSKDEEPGDATLRVLLQQAVHPMPREDELEQGTLSIQSKEFSKVAFTTFCDEFA